MYKNKKILAVIPARGGSKGVHKKNLKKINNKPIVALAGLCAKEIKEIDRIIVSTDDKEIADTALKYEIDVPFFRPIEISGDKAADLEVLAHAINEMDKIDNEKYDIIVLLQPTAPLRKSNDVLETIKILIDNNLDSVWTITKTDLKYHPIKQIKLHNNLISYVIPEGETIPRRQDLIQTYHVNGVAYALTRECVLNQKNRLGKKAGAHVIDGPSVSIDTLEDFEIVQSIFDKN
tara:strand:- start:8574 stop:9275 length:702 start_codon:yes stop_codon:yes gene_type:complete